MGETPVTGSAPPAGVDDVLRLTMVLADRILAELAAGESVPEDQCRALSAAVTLLRDQHAALPPDFEQTIEEIAQRAARTIAASPSPVSQTLSWTFARMRGEQPLTLAVPKSPSEADDA